MKIEKMSCSQCGYEFPIDKRTSCGCFAQKTKYRARINNYVLFDRLEKLEGKFRKSAEACRKKKAECATEGMAKQVRGKEAAYRDCASDVSDIIKAMRLTLEKADSVIG